MEERYCRSPCFILYGQADQVFFLTVLRVVLILFSGVEKCYTGRICFFIFAEINDNIKSGCDVTTCLLDTQQEEPHGLNGPDLDQTFDTKCNARYSP